MDGQLSIKQGDKELIATGTFLTFGSDQIELTLKYKDEIVKLLFEFVTDETSKDTGLEFQSLNTTTLKVIYKNHNHTLGSFNTEPYELGTIGNRLFYFTYFVTHINGTQRKKIDYSFYVGKEAQNG